MAICVTYRCEAFDFPVGSEVITPALTFSTSVGCLIKNSLVPVFIDVEPLSYCIDTDLIEDQITDKTVAISHQTYGEFM